MDSDGEITGEYDDALAWRNTIVLAIAYALYSCAAINIIVTAGLVGVQLAPHKGLATLPISSFVIGTALSTVPAALIMRRIGRRAGFLIGVAAGLTSAVACIYTIIARDFILFTAATTGQGVYQAFAQYYRFAAADTASPRFRPKAVSWVLAGGIAGALAGPFLIINTRQLLAPVMFAGNYAAVAVIAVIAAAILMLVKIPHRRQHGATADTGRPLGEILRQPRLLVAILAGMTSYGMMNLLMTATPIAMVACGLTVDDSAWVIQWHALAMFIPSFFTGNLIVRFGVERIIAAAMALFALAAIVGLAGVRFENFAVGLALLGLAWNFGFVGGTSMVTGCYQPAERNKVQAVNDFAVYLTVAAASLTSGQLLDAFGWNAVNKALFPAAAVTALALAWLVLHERRRRLEALKI